MLKASTDKACVMSYKYHKSHRVIWSSFAGETISISEAFDIVYVLEHNLQYILGKKLPLLMMTYSKFIFDVITGDKCTTKTRVI